MQRSRNKSGYLLQALSIHGRTDSGGPSGDSGEYDRIREKSGFTRNERPRDACFHARSLGPLRLHSSRLYQIRIIIRPAL
ncbi:hypothetical protein D3C76_1391970 [compost metagenome]